MISNQGFCQVSTRLRRKNMRLEVHRCQPDHRLERSHPRYQGGHLNLQVCLWQPFVAHHHSARHCGGGTLHIQHQAHLPRPLHVLAERQDSKLTTRLHVTWERALRCLQVTRLSSSSTKTRRGRGGGGGEGCGLNTCV